MEWFSAWFSIQLMNIFDGGYLDEDRRFSIYDVCLCFGMLILLPIAIILDLITYPIQITILNCYLCLSNTVSENEDEDNNFDKV